MKTLLFLLLSFMMMLLMGTVYTWSVFRVEVESVYALTALQSGLPYMTSLFFYALSMMLTGRRLTNKNMRMYALVGGLLIGLGWMFAAFSTSLLMLSIAYGMLIGSGVGMVYGVPIYIINRQYNGRSGLYSGIVLGGFGASPLITAPLVSMLIATLDIHTTFFVMGVLSLVVLVSASFFFKADNGLLPSQVTTDKPYDATTFWLLYGMFFMATTVGLMIIGLSYRIGVNDYGFSPQRVTIAMGVFALLNGCSRPLFGFLMDKKGFGFSATMSITLMIMAATVAFFNQGMSFGFFLVSTGLFWFNLGAWLAMVPAVIKVYFGTKNYASRYGLMFTAYGFGAITGTLLSGVMLDVFVKTRYVYGTIFVSVAMVGMLLYRFIKMKTNRLIDK